jgi:hypothetical protein
MMATIITGSMLAQGMCTFLFIILGVDVMFGSLR